MDVVLTPLPAPIEPMRTNPFLRVVASTEHPPVTPIVYPTADIPSNRRPNPAAPETLVVTRHYDSDDDNEGTDR